GGALLSAASHGTDHLIVQRLLASSSLGAAKKALVGSGIMVIFQFLLFLLIGSALWAANLAPADQPADQLFPRFIVEYLPTGMAGLMIAGILAAAMGSISSSINSMASSATHDLYAGLTGKSDPRHLLRIGRLFSAAWGVLLILGAFFFYAFTARNDSPVVVLALSIASVTYGGLLGTYILATVNPRAQGRDVIGALVFTVVVMLFVVFATPIAAATGSALLGTIGKLAWPWYVPLGTLLTVVVGFLLSRMPHRDAAPIG
ncbi:MAG: sodium:solute symporter family transporter, partial [Gemmatimonadales bacterium]